MQDSKYIAFVEVSSRISTFCQMSPICFVRLFTEMEEMAKYGTMFPPDMLGLTDEQVEELKLVDTYGETCIPSGGFTLNRDPIGRRNGKQPSEKMQEMLFRTIAEVKADISNVSSLKPIPISIMSYSTVVHSIL